MGFGYLEFFSDSPNERLKTPPATTFFDVQGPRPVDDACVRMLIAALEDDPVAVRAERDALHRAGRAPTARKKDGPYR